MTTTETKIKGIITHNGAFHADEICAIALFQIFVSDCIPIGREKPMPEQLNNPEILVIDCGGVYDLKKSNLDHHQDGDLNASNILMLSWLSENNYISHDMFMLLWKKLMSISDIDRCITKIDESGLSLNSLIRDFDRFYEALAFMRDVLRRIIKTCEKVIIDREKIAQLPTIGSLAINDSQDLLLDWKKDFGIKLMISQNREAGKYSLTSYNSDILNIPFDARQSFRHVNGFFAVYNSLEDAKNHAFDLLGDNY
jgi:uncharacterized UPF0160 family protein